MVYLLQVKEVIMDNQYFFVLGEPTRFAIVELLKKGELTVGEISTSLDIRQPQVSKHLKVLLESGLLVIRAEANKRYYSINKNAFIQMKSWVLDISEVVENQFNNLENYLKELQLGNTNNDKDNEEN